MAAEQSEKAAQEQAVGIPDLEILAPEAVFSRALEFRGRGWRFVTITCCNNKDGTFDLFYSFDQALVLRTFKTTVTQGASIPSISPVYLAAAFAENEIKELFGLSFTELVLDYGGRFMLAQDAPETPFGGGVIIERRDTGKAE